jgi:arylsulfatase A-like enzyme
LGFLQISAGRGPLDITGYTFKKRVKKRVSLKKVLKERPHIFIFLIDGCHVSHLGVYGYKRDTSPNIDRFAEDSVIFDNAYANATFTRSSVATIFTGFFPHRHKLRILTNRLPKGLFMLPEFLQKMGYKTSILTEAGNISTFFGFAQGVDHYRKVFRRWDDPRYLKNNTFKHFNNWMKTKGPLFTYVHYRAPHFPIIPPPPFLDMFKNDKSKGAQNHVIFNLVKLMRKQHKFTPEEIQDVIDDYDSTIRYVDSEVGKLFKTLKKLGLYDSSYIIFTSDHGEAMYEHGVWGHGHNVYEETSRVPLIVKFPAGKKLKGRIERITQLADIFPTFAALFGEKRYFDGQSLLESIKIKEKDDRFAFSTTFGTPPSIGIRWRAWYYIIHLFNNKEQLYHLKIDPLRDVAALKEHEDMITFFRAKFLSWLIDFDNLERTSQAVDLKKLPKGEYENLKSLGYIN